MHNWVGPWTPLKANANHHKRAGALPTNGHKRRETKAHLIVFWLLILTWPVECGLKRALDGFIDIPGDSVTLSPEGGAWLYEVSRRWFSHSDTAKWPPDGGSSWPYLFVDCGTRATVLFFAIFLVARLHFLTYLIGAQLPLSGTTWFQNCCTHLGSQINCHQELGLLLGAKST